MDPTIIVMIVTLALPNGDASVEVKPMASAAVCKEAADIEITDPFVRHAECSVLPGGMLQLQFERPGVERAPVTSAPQGAG